MYNQVIEELRRRQGGMNEAEYARYLGLTQPTLHRILNGDRRMGRRTAATISARFPKMRRLLADWLLQQDVPSALPAMEESDTVVA